MIELVIVIRQIRVVEVLVGGRQATSAVWTEPSC